MDLKNLLLFVFYWYFALGVHIRQIHPDFGLNAIQLIKKYGYPVEAHQIRTDDGYILETHRIPHGKNNQNSASKPPVLLVPGLLCGSADWVNMGGTNSLGFILADHGYDVWLSNYRGNTWSRKHETLNADTNKKNFFDYSFHEIGAYDLPANIDNVLNVTKQENLFYIGHSLGTISFFAMAAFKPEYNNKIRLMTAFAPVAYITNMDHFIFSWVEENLDYFNKLIDKYEMYEIMPYSPLLSIIAQTFCNDDSIFQSFCAEFIYLIAGRSINFNKTMIPVIVSNTPAGSSAKMFSHVSQMAIADSFQQYDYGEAMNKKKYGQITPPKYDLGKVTSPVALYYSDKDVLSVATDVDRLSAELPNVVVKKMINDYSHLDYLWATNVIPTLYDYVLENMNTYSYR
ncbi:hypothetical protein RN001_008599 [Aquatica leii]|uniref:Lipase n=1 Tax=Aquatica leii TaxID=1421715 RepID=A0AAN7SPA8_9COLE|nr:hypothetical protein RN001_008599 [Aquatica leii]